MILPGSNKPNTSFLGGKIFEYFAVTLFFSIVGLWKFWLVLFTPNAALVNWGDGLGGIASYAVLEEMLRSNVLHYLFDDKMINLHVAGGAMPAVIPPGTFWRMLLAPLLISGISYENIYDSWAFLIFVLTATSAYFFSRTLSSPKWLAIIFALFFVGMDNFNIRIVGHNTIAATFGILLQCAFAILAGQTKRLKFFVLYALASWLSFQVFEYYGFYGAIYSAMIFTGFYFSTHWNTLLSFQKDIELLKKILISLGVFVGLMLLTYPNLILGRLGLSKKGADIFVNLSHPKSELLYYSVANPLEVFYSSWMGKIDFGNPAEFTFRLGIAVLVAPCVLLTILFFRRISTSNNPLVKQSWLKLIIFLVSGLLMMLIGLQPDLPFSLSSQVFSLAPMFRVVARTFIFVDISLMVVVLIIFSDYFRCINSSPRSQFFYLMSGGAGVFLLLWVLTDISRSPLSQYSPEILPANNVVISTIQSNGAGAVIELPFFSPSDPPQNSYNYLYNWSLHGHPTINAPLNALVKENPQLASQFEAFSKDLKLISPKTVKLLGSYGIRYVVANCGDVDYHYLDKISSLQLLAKNDCSAVYQIIDFDHNHHFIDEFVKDYPVVLPDTSITLSAADCSRSNIRVVKTMGSHVFPGEPLNVEILINNLSHIKWGGDGAEVLIGAVWFIAGKNELLHNPNYGESFTRLPQPIGPKQTVTMHLRVSAPSVSGAYELWISPMQPNKLWCFHLGAGATKLPVVVQSPPR